MQLVYKDELLASAVQSWAQLEDNGIHTALKIASQQTMLLVQVHQKSRCEARDCQAPVSELSHKWAYSATKLLEVLHSANTEVQKLLACRHYCLSVKTVSSDATRCSELQMMLMDHIISADTSKDFKCAALCSLASNIRSSHYAPMPWHRFVVANIVQRNPQNGAASPDIIAPYLSALRCMCDCTGACFFSCSRTWCGG